MHKYMTIEMPDGSKWGVPVEMIARSRAKHYAHEFNGDIERSLAFDTIPLFESDSDEISDWAVNNMNWSDFDGYQAKLAESPPIDFDEVWLSGTKGFA